MDDEEEDNSPPLPVDKRRQSVFTKGCNPENEESEVRPTKHRVYPKSEKIKRKLEATIKGNILFRGLEPEQFLEIIDGMKEVQVKKGEIIIKQGEDGDYFYVINNGTYEARIRNDDGTETLMQTYTGTGSFGELALMYSQPRQATVKAITNGSIYSLDRGMFQNIVMKSAHAQRKLHYDLINKVSLFKNISNDEKLKLADVLSTKVFSDGDIIIKQGDIADGMYFVVSGSVKIMKTDNKNESPIKVIHCGDYFGELALLKNQPRAASGYAVGPTKVAFLEAKAFERLMGPCLKMMEIIAEDYV